MPRHKGSKPPAGGQPAYRFTPCRDANVLIHGEELFVNGRAYGHLHPNDAVLVDHGVVSIEQSGTGSGGASVP